MEGIFTRALHALKQDTLMVCFLHHSMYWMSCLFVRPVVGTAWCGGMLVGKTGLMCIYVCK